MLGVYRIRNNKCQTAESCGYVVVLRSFTTKISLYIGVIHSIIIALISISRLGINHTDHLHNYLPQRPVNCHSVRPCAVIEERHKIQAMDKDYANKVAELKSKIKSFPDFPKKGIIFWDIFSAISNGSVCKLLQDLLVETVRNKYPDVEAIVGLESRGFLFSFSVATELGIGCLPVRKKGKLPGVVTSYKYELEYGSDVLEIQKDSIRPGLKCLIVDDLIATGGSITAATHLLRSCGADVVGCIVVMELLSLNGRKNIPIPVHSLIQYD